MSANSPQDRIPPSTSSERSGPSSEFHSSPDSNKKISIEYFNALRVLSVLAVVFTHVSSPLVEDIRDVHSFIWWVALLYDSASRWAVPILVFISGALLLDPAKHEPMKLFFKKRADRILAPLIFWSVFFSLINYYKYHWSLKKILLKVAYGVPSAHLWYLYMILGLYLATPPLRRWIRHASPSERLYLIATTLAVASPLTMYFQVYHREVNIAFLKFLPYIGYFVCGYHLSRIAPARLKLKQLLAINLACVAVVAVGTALLVKYTAGDYVWELFHHHFSPPIIVMSGSSFLLFKKLDSLNSPIMKGIYKILDIFGPYTMGIYIVHIMIIVAIGEYAHIWSYKINPIVGIPLTSILAFVTTFAIVYPIGKIPFLKKIVI